MLYSRTKSTRKGHGPDCYVSVNGSYFGEGHESYVGCCAEEEKEISHRLAKIPVERRKLPFCLIETVRSAGPFVLTSIHEGYQQRLVFRHPVAARAFMSVLMHNPAAAKKGKRGDAAKRLEAVPA